MKNDKSVQKEIIAYIKKKAKQYGFKNRSNTLYLVREHYFAYCNYIMTASRTLIYQVYIKEYCYDDIFWKIMNMAENSNEPDSLRAVGAFAAPAISIKEGKIEFEEDYSQGVCEFVQNMSEGISDFIAKYDINEYIINIENQNVLKCLAYINTGCMEEAVELAKNAIINDDADGYINEGKTFFQWLFDKFTKSKVECFSGWNY